MKLRDRIKRQGRDAAQQQMLNQAQAFALRATRVVELVTRIVEGGASFDLPPGTPESLPRETVAEIMRFAYRRGAHDAAAALGGNFAGLEAALGPRPMLSPDAHDVALAMLREFSGPSC